MKITQEAFIRDISKELEEQNVAIFAGAGFSAPAGFVNWKELLRPIIEDLGLSVDKENDLVTVAQYHCNVNGLNRSQLTQRIIEEFSKQAQPTENHHILSRLPIETFWTTNYDKLIEDALIMQGKKVDIKYTIEHLALTKPKRDAIIYKMHGDVDHADKAILTKDDYEHYHRRMEPYITALSGDLVSKTFIFIGFSFTDPNLDYILSRVRIAYNNNQRRHFCFLKAVDRINDENDIDLAYRKRKQELFIGDLNRFNIKAVIISEYSEITKILEKIEKNYRRKSILISGAASEYGNWDKDDALKFVHDLSKRIVQQGFRVVSGFGLGIGSPVISGALEHIYMN